MAKIFVSHSQRDLDIRKEFSEVFAVAKGAYPVYMEFEQIFPPAWQKIKNEVSSSEALFVLLGPNIQSSLHTQNWVAFEVGLGCAYGKEVWIFQQGGSYSDFPIPYLTDYMEYDLREESHFNHVRKIIAGYGKSVALFPLNVDHRTKTGIPFGELITCSHDNCRSIYQLHTNLESFSCPSCRQQLTKQPQT